MVKKEKTERELKEIEYGMKLQLVQKKNEYIVNLVNGRYFFARCNMIADQLIAKNIQEKIDGCVKSEEFFRAEYALQKMQAIKSMRAAHFARLDLIKDFNLTADQIIEIEKDYYDGKIIREDYGENIKRGKAEFVNE